MRLSELKQLCINSIEYSGGTDKERQELKALWQKSWDEFIKRWAEPSGLDPLSELYFYETDKSKIVPVEKLRIVEKVTPESIAGAEKNMRRVLTEEISRLKPLTVVARNDGRGTYCMLFLIVAASEGRRSYPPKSPFDRWELREVYPPKSPLLSGDFPCLPC